LADGVFDRMQRSAIDPRSVLSASAADSFDRNLPRLRIEREGLASAAGLDIERPYRRAC
jgi:hypothetical protein